MKKWIIGFVIAASFGFKLWAATTQANNLGVVNLYLKSQTVSQIINSTSTVVGQILYCSNCTSNGGTGTICISTGTTLYNQFVLSTGTVCK